MEISHSLPLFIVKEDMRPDILHNLDCQLWGGGVCLALSSLFVQEVTTNQGGTSGPPGLAVNIHTSSLRSAADVRDELHSSL